MHSPNRKTPAEVRLCIPGKRRRVVAPARPPARRPALARPGAGAGSSFFRRCAALSLLLHAVLAWGLARHLVWPEAERPRDETIVVQLLDAPPAPPPPEPPPPEPAPPEPREIEPPPAQPEPPDPAAVLPPPPAPVPAVEEVIVLPPPPAPAPIDPPLVVTTPEPVESDPPPSFTPPIAAPPVDEYWMAVRAAVADRLHPPAGPSVATSIVVRVRATADGFEVVAPAREESLHAAAVRDALERVARRTRLAPSEESAPEAEWVVRFVEETRSTE